MLALTEQVKCRGLSEQPNDIRVATKLYNIKFIIGITWINVNLDKCEPQQQFRLGTVNYK